MDKTSNMKADIATLIVRIIVGGIFIYSGWAKVSDMASTIGFFEKLGIPTFITYFVSYAELIGGVLVLLGLWTCLVSALLAIFMIVAVYLMRDGGLMAFGLPLMTLAGLVSLIGSCGGKYSLSSCCCSKDASKV